MPKRINIDGANRETGVVIGATVYGSSFSLPWKTMGQPASKVVSETCEAVDQARLSRAKTQHAIEQNRKSIRQILDLLAELRLQEFGRHPATKPVLQLATLGDRFNLSLVRKHLEPR